MTRINRLNSVALTKLPDGWHSDGNNLYLRVLNGERYWLFRMVKDGKRVTKPLGKLSVLGLREARKIALDLKYKDCEKLFAPKQVLFKDFYIDGLDRLAAVKKWKTSTRYAVYASALKKYALPVLGDIPVAEIITEDIYNTLQPIWNTKAPTAGKLQMVLNNLFSIAIQSGIRTKANPAVWKGQLDLMLPVVSKVHKAKHHNSLMLSDVPSFAAMLHELGDLESKCWLMGLLTAGRASEYLKAKWTEVDFENAVLNVPPERRKDCKDEPFRIPLATQAMALINSMPRKNDYIFVKNNGKPYSVTYPLLTYIKQAGVDTTLHGMRSSFSVWCAENGKDRYLREACLCHTLDNAVAQAYQRSDLLEQRRPLMQEWADFCFSKITK